MYAYQSRTCTGTVGRSRNRMRRTTILNAALGGKPLLRRPRSLGFSCLYASAGILLHKLNDHRRQGDKEDDADDAKGTLRKAVWESVMK